MHGLFRTQQAVSFLKKRQHTRPRLHKLLRVLNNSTVFQSSPDFMILLSLNNPGEHIQVGQKDGTEFR